MFFNEIKNIRINNKMLCNNFKIKKISLKADLRKRNFYARSTVSNTPVLYNKMSNFNFNSLPTR